MAADTGLSATNGTLSLILIYSILGLAGLVPGSVAVLVILLVESLHIFNATVKRLQTLRDEQERERERLEQEQAEQFKKAKDDAESAKSANKLLEKCYWDSVALVAKVRGDVLTLQAELAAERNRIELLQTTRDKLKQKNKALKTKNEKLRETYENLITDCKGLYDEVDKLEDEKEEQSRREKELKREIKLLQREVKEDLQASTSQSKGGLAIPPIMTSSELPSDLQLVDPRCIDPYNGSCIGWAKTTQARCKNPMSDKGSAARISIIMRSTDPGKTFELESLRLFAKGLLCNRWHNWGSTDQSNDMAYAWYDLLYDARTALGTHHKRDSLKQRQFITPVKIRPTRYLTDSANSSSSSMSSSSTFSTSSYPSTAATTPEINDDGTERFDPMASPTPSRRRKGGNV